MKKGFVPALGTPLTKEGELLKESFVKQINDQIDQVAAENIHIAALEIAQPLSVGIAVPNAHLCVDGIDLAQLPVFYHVQKL